MTDWEAAIRRVEEAVPAALVRRSGEVLRVDVGTRTLYMMPDTALTTPPEELATYVETMTMGGGLR